MARSISLGLLCPVIAVASLTFSVPPSLPKTSSPKLSPAPVGLSFEFFAFPEYFSSVYSTTPCLKNLEDLSGVWPRIRIGGTTQDRALYDPTLSTAVNYSVASPDDAPLALTFGPSFFSQANQYRGAATIGLNRGKNNLSNTIEAAKVAKATMSNLYALELGNEPNLYSSTSPIAEGQAWTPARDYSSQNYWQTAMGKSLGVSNIIQAGVYLEAGSYTNAGLANVENNTAISFVKTFDSHHYPQSASTADLAALMDHAKIASRVAAFKGEVAAAKAKGKLHVFGETNSATQGGGGISPTFGAGLWIVDYVLLALLIGTDALFFHQGTIGNCQYCWWGRYSMGAPYYGAYFAAEALANISYVAPLDAANTTYAAYALYDSSKQPRKVLLYNSDYYTSGVRSSQTFTLEGLTGSSVSAKRLTAPAATSRQDRGQNPTIGGQTFANGTCAMQGNAKIESAEVSLGKATFAVAASEALLVFL